MHFDDDIRVMSGSPEAGQHETQAHVELVFASRERLPQRMYTIEHVYIYIYIARCVPIHKYTYYIHVHVAIACPGICLIKE